MKKATLLNSSDHDFDSMVGDYLRATRVNKGLTGKELGTVMHMSQQQISRYERGRNKVSLDFIFNYVTVLVLPMSHFFNYIDVKLQSSEIQSAIDNKYCTSFNPFEAYLADIEYLSIR